MINPYDGILMLLFLSVLLAFASSRILTMIKVISFQGIAVSIVPILQHHDPSASALIFGFLMMTVRGLVIPGLLYFAVRKIAVKREIEPLIGYHLSIFAGLVLIIFSVFISSKFQLPVNNSSLLTMPAAITILVGGLFLLMARNKAITMLIGYMMLENGIYIIGASFSKSTHHVVEFVILLDVLVGVMIMGIVLYNIKRTFDDIDTNHLRNLKD
ncbi:MAG: hydrogenase [SAR324 cluster bacterium]|nr:hydrogenase [SAR324 cluster bacterium]